MRTYSDLDHYEKEVKRRNFVTLFLDNYNADKYIVTHLYGALDYLDANVSFDDLENIFDTSAQNLSQTFDKCIDELGTLADKIFILYSEVTALSE